MLNITVVFRMIYFMSKINDIPVGTADEESRRSPTERE